MTTQLQTSVSLRGTLRKPAPESNWQLGAVLLSPPVPRSACRELLGILIIESAAATKKNYLKKRKLEFRANQKQQLHDPVGGSSIQNASLALALTKACRVLSSEHSKRQHEQLRERTAVNGFRGYFLANAQTKVGRSALKFIGKRRESTRDVTLQDY